MTFRDLFDSVKAGKYAIIPASEKLTHSEIKKALVGVDKTALSVVDQRLNVVEVPKIAFHCFLYCVCFFALDHCYIIQVQGSPN